MDIFSVLAGLFVVLALVAVVIVDCLDSGNKSDKGSDPSSDSVRETINGKDVYVDSSFNVVVEKDSHVFADRGQRQTIVKLNYASNGFEFMRSEPYVNKRFAYKKAEQLAEELGVEVIYKDE